MEICNNLECTGCMACLDICKHNAIKQVIDKNGFVFPKIDKEKCVSCKQCQKICPVNNQYKNTKSSIVLACWNNSKKIRISSSSGGVFFLLAEAVIKSGGIVYGAALNENLYIEHQRITSLSDIKNIQGSKYVQSNTKGIFKLVKNDLENDKIVLFSGTPCQVSGLKTYINKKYPKLICIDLVCHGVPSPQLFTDYIHYITQKYNKPPKNIIFRYKKPNWTVSSMKIDFVNKQSYISSKFNDPYLSFFLSDLSLRPSCFYCKFSTEERAGDITLGDFWNFKALQFDQRSIEKGVSLVILSTLKGKQLFNHISCNLYMKECNWIDAHNSNQSLSRPWRKPENYEEFWEDYKNKCFEDLQIKYCTQQQLEKQFLKESWKRAHYYLINFMGLKRFINFFKGKIKCK